MYEPSLLSGVPTADIPWIIGRVLAIGWVCLYFLSWAIQLAIAWVDDSTTCGYNKFFKMTANLIGYVKTDGGCWDYRHKVLFNIDCDDPTGFFMVFFILMPVLLVLPPLIYFQWLACVVLGVIFVLLYTLRGGRRVQKKLKAHIEDKNAHKE